MIYEDLWYDSLALWSSHQSSLEMDRFSSTWIMHGSCGGKIFPPVSSQKLHEKFCATWRATPKMHDGRKFGAI
jgi:hypothetical protein